MWIKIIPNDSPKGFDRSGYILYSSDTESVSITKVQNVFHFSLKVADQDQLIAYLKEFNISSFEKFHNILVISITSQNKLQTFLDYMHETYQFSFEMYLHFATAMSLTPTLNVIAEEIQKNSIEETEKQIKHFYTVIPDKIQLILAEILIQNGETESAIEKLNNISKVNDINAYQQAQYLLGQSIYTGTYSSEYLTIRDHARQAFIHFNEAGNYADADLLRIELYDILCFGNDKLNAKHIVNAMPPGNTTTLLQIADSFYQIFKEKEALLQQKEEATATEKLNQAKKQVKKEGFFSWKSFEEKADKPHNLHKSKKK